MEPAVDDEAGPADCEVLDVGVIKGRGDEVYDDTADAMDETPLPAVATAGAPTANTSGGERPALLLRSACCDARPLLGFDRAFTCVEDTCLVVGSLCMLKARG